MFLLLLMLGLKLFSAAELRRRFPRDVAHRLLCAGDQSGGDGLGAWVQVMAGLTPLLASVPPIVMLLMVYLLTLIMTELMTNNAAAALMFPLGYSVALSSGYEPMAFVMAVALGAALFLTPFGYTTNLMVQNLGDIRAPITYALVGFSCATRRRFWCCCLAFSAVRQSYAVSLSRHHLMSRSNHR